jgi:predicted nucleic acid-binding protein
MARRAVRVFLDSNVILSGLLSDAGAPRIILDLLSVRFPVLKGMTGRYNLREIERNLALKLPRAIPVFAEYFPRMRLAIVPLPPLVQVEVFRGRIADKDAPVIAAAVLGGADYLVTGDRKDFGRLKTTLQPPPHIVTPAEFVDEVLPDILKSLGAGKFLPLSRGRRKQ